ncbi:MAG TPA: S9 family peptidase [Actinomycetota bacterium]
MPGMGPHDVVHLSAAGDPRVSPDATTVAYVRSWIDPEEMAYRSAIELVAVDGSTAPRQVTSGAHRDAEPRWSPDGRWLAYTSARGEDPAQLWVLPADGPGEPRRLTDRDEAVQQIAWAPDGTRLVFVARVRDAAYAEEDQSKREPRRIRRLLSRLDNEGWIVDRPRHLFVVAVGDGEVRQLTDGDAEDTAPAWSPDGATIAFASARHEDWDLDWVTDLYLVDAEGGAPRRLTGGDGGCANPAWSPDGTRLAYLYTPGVLDEPRNGRVAVVDAATGERTVLTESLDRTCAPYPPLRAPVWDGDDVVFAYEDRGAVVLGRVAATGVTGHGVADVVRADGCVTGYDVAAGIVVHAWSDPVAPAEIVAGATPLSRAGDRFLAAVAPIAPVAFTATSPDGTEVDAWAILPPIEHGAQVPLLLNIHGGPFTQYGNKLFDEFQVYAGAGYGVVYANPRGSSGGPESWGRAIRGPIDGGPGWGSVDFQDLMAVVDEALRRFDVLDPDRMGVMGGSYGGYMTSWVVGHTDRFRCAISERAVNDAVSMEGASDIAGFFQAYAGGPWWEDRAAYEAMSPISYLQDITTPLLILHSEDDLRCPIGQGEQLFVALRRLRRDVELVRFPKEGHELTRSGSPTHRVRRFEIVLEFLARHLQP